MIGDGYMFVCIECGNVFQEPMRWEEKHGLDSGPYERFSGCPNCGSSYTKAYRCDYCREWITGDYIKVENDNRYCENCFKHMELGEEL